MSSPNPHSRRVRSSVHQDFSDLDSLLGQMEAIEEKAKEHQDTANEHAALANEELKAKATLLQDSNIPAFVQKCCEEKGLKFEGPAFILDGNANLRLNTKFVAGSVQNQQVMQIITRTFGAIGVPDNYITRGLGYFDVQIGESQQTMPVALESLYFPVNQQTLQGLIEKATEDRFESIKSKYNQAASAPSHENLMEVGQLIEKETGYEVIDDAPEKSMRFTDAVQSRIKNDIRRKVTDELLGDLAREMPGNDIAL